MEIKELVEQNIDFGLNVLPSHLSRKADMDSYLYLKQAEISNDTIVAQEGSLYVAEKNLRKFYKNFEKHILAYKDIIASKQDATIFVQDAYELLNSEVKGILVSNDFLLIRPSTGYLNTFFQDKAGKAYFQEKLKSILAYETIDIIAEVEQINIPLEINRIEEVRNQGEEVFKRKVDISKISINQQVITLDKILKRVAEREIRIPDLQRKSGLWGDDVKVRLMEALIVKQPIPAFYFDASNDDEWLIIDGLQRLSTIEQFVNQNKDLKINLTNNPKELRLFKEHLTYLPEEFNDLAFEELPRWAQRNIEEFEILAYKIEKGTPDEVKYKIFHSINIGNLVLEDQEARHAFNDKKPAKWLDEFRNRPIFKHMMPLTPEDIDRMKDAEYALRFLAFRMNPYKDYEPQRTIKDFLDIAMKKIDSVPDDKLKQYEEDFGGALFHIDRIFGNKAFKRSALGDLNARDVFIIPLYEIMTYAFSVITQEQREKLEKNKSMVLHKTAKLVENTAFMQSIESERAYTKTSVKIRFETFENHIKNLLQ
jgi:hypothetical protein